MGLAKLLVSLKEGSCEVKLSHLVAQELKIEQKLRLKRLDLHFFLKMGGGLSTDKLFHLKWDPCELRERHEKGGLQGHTSPYSLSTSVPPPREIILPYLERKNIKFY